MPIAVRIDMECEIVYKRLYDPAIHQNLTDFQISISVQLIGKQQQRRAANAQETQSECDE